MNPFLRSTFGAVALAASAFAQCNQNIQANWNAVVSPHQEAGTVERRAMLVENNSTVPIQVCSVAMKLSHNMNLWLGGNATVWYQFRQVVTVGALQVPGNAISVATNVNNITNIQQTLRGTFPIPFVLQPGQKAYLTANYSIPSYYLGNGNIRTPNTQGTTTVECWKYGSSSGWNMTWSHDPGPFCYDMEVRSMVQAVSTNLGGGCLHAPGQPMATLVANQPLYGTTWYGTINNATPGGLTLLSIGLTNPALNLASIGSPGCTLLSSSEVLVGGIASGSGSFAGSIDLPNSSSSVGQQFYAQGVVLDLLTGSLQIGLSNGRRQTIGEF